MWVTNTANEYCLLSVMPTLLRITPRRTTTVFKKLEAQQPTLHIPFPANKAPCTENFSDAHTIHFLTWYENTSDIAFCINELEEDDIEMRRAVDLGQAVFDMRNPHKILTYLPTCAHAHFLALYTACPPERRKTGANASHQFKQWLTQEITLGALSYIVNEPDDATVPLSRKLKYLEIGTYQESKFIKYCNIKQGSRHYFCDACGKREHDPEQLSSCSKCKKVRYCNTTCQKQHWYAHKKECKTYTSPFPKIAPAC